MIIDGIELHDCPLERIDFLLSQEKVNIHILPYNETAKDYFKKVLRFIGVTNIKSNQFILANFFDLEIYSCEIIEVDNIKTVKFTFLMGFSMPDCNLSFDFSDFVMADNDGE